MRSVSACSPVQEVLQSVQDRRTCLYRMHSVLPRYNVELDTMSSGGLELPRIQRRAYHARASAMVLYHLVEGMYRICHPSARLSIYDCRYVFCGVLRGQRRIVQRWRIDRKPRKIGYDSRLVMAVEETKCRFGFDNVARTVEPCKNRREQPDWYLQAARRSC